MADGLQHKVLRAKRSQEELALYRAALEWDLIDPIVIESKEDFKSEPTWKDRVTPFAHQVTNLITYCRRLPVTLLADDVGLGKTVSAGLIASELMSRGRVSNILVVCPKLLGPQWTEELHSKFAIPAEIAIGRDLIEADPKDSGAVITTYHSARMYLESLPQERFEMLILDEAHKLRNLYGVESPPQVAQLFRKLLQQRRFRFVLMLTATPIHNRLWDLYSLVDLLTVARGHKNPFGSEGMFARKFIADDKESARHLKPEAKDEFRSVVYGYMSRTRRNDAKLFFPDRVVKMHKPVPTNAELELIKVVGKSIEKLNRLAQISILQALASSPDALKAQLDNMARNGTVPNELASAVRTIVASMPLSAKLTSVGVLMDELAKENPEKWRAVIFTGRLETQTTIQAFCESKGLKVGIINGGSGARNQSTIAGFKAVPPAFHVIVSTEAGSEGVNLQVANVLVNFDLPWNPMIVEQRIGRVQRLASEHGKVLIYNVMLRGTFEEYIVGRLMEKLQMASHAIGDIESLLEATGTDGDDDGSQSFEEKIRKLVVAALVGKDTEVATRQAEESIEAAKVTLAQERQSIDELLSGSDSGGYVGPRTPTLHRATPSVPAELFAKQGLELLGARVRPYESGLYVVEKDGGRSYIRFANAPEGAPRSVLYAPSSPAFQRLVDEIATTSIHDVVDVDNDPASMSAAIVRSWISKFGGIPTSLKATDVRRCFDGQALVRARATTAVDSYERLVDVDCCAQDHSAAHGIKAMGPLHPLIEDPRVVGLDREKVMESAVNDESLAEFCRFYTERRDQEVAAAGDDERKRSKNHEDFTPRLQLLLVSLAGTMHRRVKVSVAYSLGGDGHYADLVEVCPSTQSVIDEPTFGVCDSTKRSVPASCLENCCISGAKVVRHMLQKSESSGRYGLPQHVTRCDVSGKRLLVDEVATSHVTGKRVEVQRLGVSGISGHRAEPEFIATCEFTGVVGIGGEIGVSEVSGKKFRKDEGAQSAVSGKMGHKSEFSQCPETGKVLAESEGETCAVTGVRVMPGALAVCDVTGRRVRPSELGRCMASGKRAIRQLLVRSSVSGAYLLETESVTSTRGEHCLPQEATACAWSGRRTHPHDVRQCELTKLVIHADYATPQTPFRLQPLDSLLNGVAHDQDGPETWARLIEAVSRAGHKGKMRVEASIRSPGGDVLAAVLEVKAMLGLRVQWVGIVYALTKGVAIGRIPMGKRNRGGWLETD